MTHVSRKRQNSENAEAETETPKKKKVLEKANGSVETQTAVSKAEEVSAAEPTYTAKLFTLELRSETSWLSALEKFHDTFVHCEEQEARDSGSAPYDIVLEYLRLASEGLSEILQYVHVRRKRTELALCFQVLCDILQRAAAKTQLSAYLSVAERVGRIVLTRHVQALWLLLTGERGKAKSYQIKVVLRFLSACVSLNDELARFSWDRMGAFSDRIFQGLLHRTDLADAEDVRMCAVQLLLSFLLSDDSDFINKVLGQVATFTNVFARLNSDKFGTLVLVLSTLIERVVRNERVTPAVRRRFFSVGKPARVEQLAALGDWRGPQRSEFWNLYDRRKAHLDAPTQSDVLVESEDRTRIVHQLAQTLLDELNATPTVTPSSTGAQPLGAEAEAAAGVQGDASASASASVSDLSVEAIADALFETDKKRRHFVSHVHAALQAGAFRKPKHASSFCKHVPRMFAAALVFRSSQLCTLLNTLFDTDAGADDSIRQCIGLAVREHVTARNAKWVAALLTRGTSQRNASLNLVRLVLKVRKHSREHTFGQDQESEQARVEQDRRDGALYLCAYGASLGELDCALFELLGDMLTDDGVRCALRPYFWGAKAVDHFRVERDRAQAEPAASAHAASLDSLVLTLDATRLLSTCVHFPMHLALNDRSPCTTAPIADLYDPRFLLAVLADLLDESRTFGALNDFVERHCLSLAIAALSSHDAPMRQLGCVIVARFATAVKRRDVSTARPPTAAGGKAAHAVPQRVGRNAALTSWREEVRFLVDLLRCALVGAANESESDSGGNSGSGAEEWKVVRVPFVVASFFVRAIELIVNDPENELYRRLYERMLDERGGASWRRLLSSANASLFLGTFVCECVVGIPTELGSHAKVARGWALQLLATGLREPADYHVVFAHAAERHNQLFSVLLATLSSSIVQDNIRSLAVDALLRVVETCPPAEHSVLHSLLLHLLATLHRSIAPRLRHYLARLYLALCSRFSAHQRALHATHLRTLGRLLASPTLPTSVSDELARVAHQLQPVQPQS